MNILQKTISPIDSWQRRHYYAAFPYAVVKKYGEDEAGYQAALLTYYGFLSLFPLLLVLTTLVTILGGENDALRRTVLSAMTDYFPVFGDQLSNKIQAIDKSGGPLVVGIILTLYGARGVADVFRTGVNHIWQTPRTKRDGFPIGLGKSFAIIFIGGFGFLLANITSAFAAEAGEGLVFRGLAILLNIFILFWLFRILLNLSLAKSVPARSMRSGAITAAIGLVFLQIVGTKILTTQLESLDAVYSYFAVALGLLFWLYLQSQVIYYAVEVSSVRSLKLYPRGMQDFDLTSADKRALGHQAEREQRVEDEKITTKFEKTKK
jgi:YihY family inner membrane protein